ncbi:SMP-30/gluconolactonase/LRE family protein [Novosphingobium sp. JCM 18896]|uniref:SMP-30/gluconolactonase/LRE family protein n=1 Tax=Novosphingobium sp. JCM 18896 TaxID=2989731 RepID=UPI00222397CA|nr:SMP-30/gluconolactonase/LRE family protein [Novosphingobium sp. JCM 18896]MCW1428366.1 SMP-30/gluconolactonase/LRE family protein [Novosphingobium sp. JCM 18896]
MTEVRTAFDANNHLGETPAWSEAEQALWWINCEHEPELHRWHPESNEHRVWPMPRRIGGFVFKADGGLLVALADGLYDFDPASDDLAFRVPSPFPSHVHLHECACDRQGRFWIGGYDTRFIAERVSADAAYCRLDGDRLVPVITGVHVANGLAFSPDGRTMYAVTSPTRQVEAFDLDPATGNLSNRRPFVLLGDGEGFADGATVDSAGGYWMANVAAGALRRYRPDGTLDRTVPLPFSNPTKPAFGGPDRATLFVTSTQMAMPPVTPPTVANGAVFALEPGEPGLPEVPFAG